MTRTAEVFRDRIENWSHLSELVEHFSFFNGHDWLFRGVSDASHGLRPHVGREKARARKPKGGTGRLERIPWRLGDEKAIFEMFRRQARSHLAVVPQNDLEWLALARHFGLPTRLLDWTDSLLAAAWFAVEKQGNKKVDSAIWVTKDIPSAESTATDPFAIKSAALYRPPHISPRIGAQGSVLMVCPAPTTDVHLPFLRKIQIPRKAEFTLKKRLSACGINRRHLFADLAGLCDHLGWLYNNDWLAGNRRASR